MAHTVKGLLAALALLASPAFAQTDTIRFAAFGDYGKGTGTTAVAQLVNNQAPDFIVALGDNCYGATPPIATQVGTPYGNWVTDSRFWPALGNHEFSDGCGGGSAASGYRDYFTLPNNERYYDIVIGPVHFFALNSEVEPDGNSATSTQAKWLKAKLAASSSPWQVVFFHHPPYSSGGGTKKGMRWPFEKWGVDAVLSGHAHDYERILKDANADGVTLPYFVSGLGGKSIGSFSGNVSGSAMRYNAEYGSMFITASSTTIDFEFRNVSGAVIDSYSITKPATPSPTKFEWKIPPHSH
jgi:tartrate-resistant acid phosphatase type 5